jgi:methionyl-tRNA synthetase
MKEEIQFDDFAKLDIALGTIAAVEVVPETDKLLQLTVEVGEESSRQIISGIREYFTDPQELVGVQCPFLLNIAPRKIRGLVSHGMILAADHEALFSLLRSTPPLPNGTRVR